MKFPNLCSGFASLLLFAATASAEQKTMVGDYAVHHIVIPTLFLNQQVAAQYNLVRAKDRALVNIAVLDSNNQAQHATVSGSARNLLGQSQDLEFAAVEEGEAIYYLATLRHADEEHQRLEITITLDDGTTGTIELQQKMYWQH